MNILMISKNILLKTKFNIVLNDNEIYYSETNRFNFFKTTYVYERIRKSEIVTIHESFSVDKGKYKVVFLNRDIALCTLSSIFCKCIFGNDLYYVKRNKGSKYSIFKNSEQIGYWDLSYHKEVKYSIVANNDVNEVLLISLCIVIDNYERVKNRSLYYNDIGYYDGEVDEFDSNWRAKI